MMLLVPKSIVWRLGLVLLEEMEIVEEVGFRCDAFRFEFFLESNLRRRLLVDGVDRLGWVVVGLVDHLGLVVVVVEEVVVPLVVGELRREGPRVLMDSTDFPLLKQAPLLPRPPPRTPIRAHPPYRNPHCQKLLLLQPPSLPSPKISSPSPPSSTSTAEVTSRRRRLHSFRRGSSHPRPVEDDRPSSRTSPLLDRGKCTRFLEDRTCSIPRCG